MLKSKRKVLLSSMLAFIMLFSNTSFVLAEETTEIEKTEIVEEVEKIETTTGTNMEKTSPEKVEEVIIDENVKEETNLIPMMPFAASSGGSRIVEMKRHSRETENYSDWVWSDWSTLTRTDGSYALISVKNIGTYIFDMVNNKSMTLTAATGSGQSLGGIYSDISTANDEFGINIEYEPYYGFRMRLQPRNGYSEVDVTVGITIFE